jgi:transcriptional regulator with XRE-family HTH domain
MARNNDEPLARRLGLARIKVSGESTIQNGSTGAMLTAGSGVHAYSGRQGKQPVQEAQHVNDMHTVGDRVRDVRKRRGLSQRQLADLSGVSISLIRKLEQDDYGNVRLETLHKLAATLRIPTTALATESDADGPDKQEVQQWAAVRRALEGRVDGAEPAEEPTAAGLATAFDSAVLAVLESRHADVRASLPDLLRDADTLVAVSVNGAETQARRLRSQIRQMTTYMMGQTWQFEAANYASDLAIDDASDGFTEMAALDWKSWAMLRQGHLAQARDLATRWADEAEPRISKATRDELAAWGRFLIRLSSAAVRDNRPGEARDALRLARVAAVAAGGDYIPSHAPWQVFGPITVSMIQAENAMIQGRPDITLTIAGQLEGRNFPVPRNWNRHRLDVAHAHVAHSHYGEAVIVLQEVRAAAPQWLAQQRYARDILQKVIVHRRTLTEDMRELADFMHLAL